LVNPIGRLLTTGIANKRTLDLSREAIRKQSIGAMKSMPQHLPLIQTNLTPVTTEFKKQADALRAHSDAIAKSMSDTRMKIAQNNMTSSQIMKGEDSLLGTISKQITDTDLQNAKLRMQHEAIEREVADYNDNIGGKTAAALLNAEAQHVKQIGDAVEKILAESQDQYYKFKNVAGYAKNWKKY
jgi:chromosome segregation ATPase